MSNARRDKVFKSPSELIRPLWDGPDPCVVMEQKDWKRVLLYYGRSLHMRAGQGCVLVGERIGPGVYEVRLKEKVYE